MLIKTIFSDSNHQNLNNNKIIILNMISTVTTTSTVTTSTMATPAVITATSSAYFVSYSAIAVVALIVLLATKQILSSEARKTLKLIVLSLVLTWLFCHSYLFY